MALFLLTHIQRQKCNVILISICHTAVCAAIFVSLRTYMTCGLTLCFAFLVGSGPSAVSESSQAALQKTQWAEPLTLHFRGWFHVISVSIKQQSLLNIKCTALSFANVNPQCKAADMAWTVHAGVLLILVISSLSSYLIEKGVCYLVLCEGSFPKKLAFAYLEDLQGEFHEQHGRKVPTVSRPYSFIEFGMKM